MSNHYKKYSKIKDDGRVKIPLSQHEEVRRFYEGIRSQRATARHFNVSRKLIQLIINPDKYKNQLKERRDRKVHLKYYDKDVHKLAMRKYRAKKKELGIDRN